MKICSSLALLLTLSALGCSDVMAGSSAARLEADSDPFGTYAFGNSVTLSELVRLAEDGNAISQYVLGNEYMYAEDRSFRDLDLAILWFDKSANQGYLRAQKDLAMIYTPKFGEKPEAEKSFYWSLKAAEQGDAYSQLQVSNAYIFGEGVGQDFSESLFWLRTSALNGEDEAQRILGVRYFEGNVEFKGNVVRQDRHEALYWLEKSAAQGNYDAEVEVVRILYLYSAGDVSKDHAKAFRLARSYVDNNSVSHDSTLYYILGEMYQYGRGTRQDISKAKESYRLSCDDGGKAGCDKYRELK
jgi:TPR repeat protein